MTRKHARPLAALVAGLLFGAGLVIGGMTSPSKVIGFLDLFGRWNSTLVFVMAGAVAVHTLGYRLIVRRPAPLFAERFALPTRRELDPKLLLGAALFGLGWGLSGFCPGPGVVALASGQLGVWVFVLSMLGGIWITARVEARLARRPPQQATVSPASAACEPQQDAPLFARDAL